MEGILFFWVSWMFWVIATFFMDKKNKNRIKFSVWILLLIILSPYTINVFGVKTSTAGIFLLVSLYIFASRLEKLKKVYFLFCAFILMMAFVSFHLFELFDPVWVIFPREWMLALLLVYMSVLLQENRINRVPLIFLGAIQGEILYALILGQYSFPYVIGSLAFFDIMALSASIVGIWSMVEWLAAYFENNIKHFEREKQKLS